MSNIVPKATLKTQRYFKSIVRLNTVNSLSLNKGHKYHSSQVFKM